jgi:hypothetical protein
MAAQSEVMRGADGKYLAARLHDLVCYYYVNQESEANFRAFSEWTARLPSLCPRGTGTMIWVDAVAALHPPPEPVRRAYSELAAHNASRQFGRVHIVQATGFAGATIRAVLTSLGLIRRSQVRQHYTDDALAGLRWLYAQLPSDPERPSPEAACAFFQQTLDDYRRRFPG